MGNLELKQEIIEQERNNLREDIKKMGNIKHWSEQILFRTET